MGEFSSNLVLEEHTFRVLPLLVSLLLLLFGSTFPHVLFRLEKLAFPQRLLVTIAVE